MSAMMVIQAQGSFELLQKSNSKCRDRNSYAGKMRLEKQKLKGDTF
jgi:hypothetical protein